jgi:hypothetical protein
VYEKSLGMKHFRLLRTDEEKMSLRGQPESLEKKRFKKPSNGDSFGGIIDASQEGKTEILVLSLAAGPA